MYHTLEVEWFLRPRCATTECCALLTSALKEMESFLRAGEYGIRLLQVAASEPGTVAKDSPEILDLHVRLMTGFETFFGRPPDTLSPVSCEMLRRAERYELLQRYTVMRAHSFADCVVRDSRWAGLRKRLGSAPVPYDGEMRALTLERAIRTCFHTSGFTGHIRRNLASGFAKLVENELAAIWFAYLAAAAAGHEALPSLERFVPVLRRTVPLGIMLEHDRIAYYLVA